jgi:hypothetical protein
MIALSSAVARVLDMDMAPEKASIPASPGTEPDA